MAILVAIATLLWRKTQASTLPIKSKMENPAWPKREYRAMIFDCDGTLTDSMPVHFLAWHRIMLRHGIEFTEDRFYALGGMPSVKIVDVLAGERGIRLDGKAVADEKENEFLTMLHLLVPIQPVIDVARLHRGKSYLAVASGGYRAIIERQLEQIGCTDWFEVLVTAEDTERHKPAPDVFLKAAELLNVAPQECLVYEDSSLGLQAAAAAGMDVIDIRTFHTPRRMPLT